MTYKIVTDSSSNLLELQHIDFANVPMKIVTDEKEYIDNAALSVSNMANELKAYKGRSGTSCPSIGEWVDAFGDADIVFAVTITSNLSGSYAAAVEAKKLYEESHPGKRVCVVDSLSAGAEMQMIAERIEELMLEEKSYEEIEATITEYCKHTRLQFCLEHMDNLARNGRVNPVVAAAAGLLGIRVVGKASDVGTLEPQHKVRGEKKAIETIFSSMKQEGYAGGKVNIGHCFNLDAASKLRSMILKEFPGASVVTSEIRGLCCFYAELGGLMVGYECK